MCPLDPSVERLARCSESLWNSPAGLYGDTQPTQGTVPSDEEVDSPADSSAALTTTALSRTLTFPLHHPIFSASFFRSSTVRLRGDDELMRSMTEEQRRVASTFVTEMDQHGIGKDRLIAGLG